MGSDYPRVPLTGSTDLFLGLVDKGRRLIDAHLLKGVGTGGVTYPNSGSDLVEVARFEESDVSEGRVKISGTQWFEGVPEEAWRFRIGAYQVCEKWLKERIGRKLTYGEKQHFKQIVEAIETSITTMQEIDDLIDTHGGWPIA